ncbi:hypothetical protein VNO77_02260 [Canavalia gladiata]|uniref:Uncharacterized protein n=1 Tax=Canavalia gladiata TaxID=3824 RepID=A0AAN9MXX8_CANGL
MGKGLMILLFMIIAMFMGMVGSNLFGDIKPAVPAVFVFGDSTFDVGTNNFLNDSKATATQPFYGIDFPNKISTGRFSNGFNIADRIVQLLGFNASPPAYLYLLNNDTQNFNRDILKGVNFASGGSGILPKTGKQIYIDVVPMEDQIQQFTTIHGNMSQYVNESNAKAIINKSLFLVSVGSNDLFEFFYFNASKHPNNFTLVVEFMNNLASNYQVQLKNLINLGARKFGILSVPPIGCVPVLSAIANPKTHCLDQLNTLARFFYEEVVFMLKNLKSECPDIQYSLGDSLNITNSMVDNRASLHLDDVTSACCGNQTLNMNGLLEGVPCSPEANLCDNRSNFLFWDQYHPTDYVSQIAASKLYSGGNEFVTPMNFSLLVKS